MKKPNILFVLTDQQRKDTLSVYGDSACETPNLDQLAAQSTTFDNAYTTCPICTPARASLQTGLYPIHHGMLSNSYNYGNMVQELPDSPGLLSRRLQEAGYQAGYTGKWHLGSGIENVKKDAYIQKYMKDIQFAEIALGKDSVPTALGYQGDDFPGHGFGGHIYPEYKEYLAKLGLEHRLAGVIKGHYNDHQAGEVTSGLESTIEHFLVERSKKLITGFEEQSEPWYLQLNFWGPHEPYYAPSEFLKKYQDMTIPPWKNYQGDSENKPRIHDVKRGNITEWADVLPYVQHYFACMSHIDYQIGRLLDFLKDRGLYEDTLIIFSSDHGESLGIHNGLCDKAVFMYEETCSIPLLIKQENQKESERLSELVSSCDIYSTILDYAGLDKEKTARDGQSMRPLLEHQPVPWPETVVTECSGIGSLLFSQRMIRKGSLKYIFNSGDLDELYDLSEDPYEKINRIDDPACQKLVNEMQHSLLQWMEEHRDNLIFEFKALRMREK